MRNRRLGTHHYIFVNAATVRWRGSARRRPGPAQADAWAAASPRSRHDAVLSIIPLIPPITSVRLTQP